MTAEIWTMVIIAITQTIVMLLIGYWQVRTMKQIENPTKKDDKPKRNIFGKFSKYTRHKSSIFLLFIPIYLYVIFKIFISSEPNEIKIISYTFSALLVVGTAAISTLLSIIESLITTSKCHMERLDKLTDRPCKDESCPF